MADDRATFDELLEHLEDLIILAETEGFDRFAHMLAGARLMIRSNRNVYSHQVAPWPAPSSTPLRRST